MLKPNCLVYFIDETGHEKFSDPQFPIFGLGGCAVISQSYSTFIQEPWRKLKTDHFRGSNQPLHASDLHALNAEQIDALANFFQLNTFSRFFACANSKTDIDTNLSAYQAVGLAILERIRKIASRHLFDSVVIIFESCERTNNICKDFFSPVSLQIENKPLQIEYFKMEKSACEPGLEVADFIIHTSGAQLQYQLKGLNRGKKKYRKDFECMFQIEDKNLIDGLFIDSVSRNS